MIWQQTNTFVEYQYSWFGMCVPDTGLYNRSDRSHGSWQHYLRGASCERPRGFVFLWKCMSSAASTVCTRHCAMQLSTDPDATNTFRQEHTVKARKKIGCVSKTWFRSWRCCFEKGFLNVFLRDLYITSFKYRLSCLGNTINRCPQHENPILNSVYEGGHARRSVDHRSLYSMLVPSLEKILLLEYLRFALTFQQSMFFVAPVCGGCTHHHLQMWRRSPSLSPCCVIREPLSMLTKLLFYATQLAGVARALPTYLIVTSASFSLLI